MSGGNLPYHLRTNKAVDRDIFFELLSRLKLPHPIQDYQYITLGGPMLEDLKQLHHRLGLENLKSLEKDDSVLSRQKYNKPFNCIECTKSSTEEFIQNFEPQAPCIIWLDYTAPSWRTQFEECHSLIGKLEPYDIIKITLNANPDSLGTERSAEEKLERFKQKAGGPYTCQNLTANDVSTMTGLPATLAGIIETVSQSALDMLEELTLKPLTLFRYIDSTQMLTLSCIVLPVDEGLYEELLENSKLNNWPHLTKDWADIHEITVPSLTIKEQQAINQFLPLGNRTLNPGDLPFAVHANPTINKRLLDNYIKYYRYIPNFHRLAV